MKVLQIPYVLVDGGDFILRDGADGDLKSAATWKDMSARGYHAVTLGEFELSQWTLTQTLMAEYPLPVICSNVEALQDGRWVPIGAKSKIVEVNGVRIGIFSVIGEGQLSRALIDKTGGAIQLLPPMETAAAIAAGLRHQTDILVLLAHVDPRAMEQYATVLTDVDVIVGGHSTENDEGPLLVGDAIVNRSGTKGQNVGITRLIVSPDNRIVDFGGVNLTLAPGYPEDEAVKAEVERVEKANNELKREKARLALEERAKKIGSENPSNTNEPPKQQ